MCGIIGINSFTLVAKRLLYGLGRLEYRGYDSAGLAVIDSDGDIKRQRSAGKLRNLKQLFTTYPIDGNIGIGHTRWATHGSPTDANAHPHSTDRIAVVHNGIIENSPAIKTSLGAIDWQSDTDTEVIAHLLTQLLDQTHDLKHAMQQLLKRLEGAFALAIILRDYNDLMLVARQGSPIAIARSDKETMVGSDATALSGLSCQIYYLHDGEWAILGKERVTLFDKNTKIIEPKWRPMPVNITQLDKCNFPHAMLHEIHEQPSAISNTLNTLIDSKTLEMFIDNKHIEQYKKASIVQFCACGTSYYATQVAGYWFETLAHLVVRHDIASELRYRNICALPDSIGIFVSQSGETMDTLEAMHHWQSLQAKAVAIVNTPESSIARTANHTLYTVAGPEISVASTKAFTTQLTALCCFALWIARLRNHINDEYLSIIIQDFIRLPDLITRSLDLQSHYQQVAHDILVPAEGVFFLGRGNLYPLALEGALKLKEITYMHAEGYAAGEMKHGPIALVSNKLPVVFLAPYDGLITKNMSNIKEITARGGHIILLSDDKGLKTAYEHGLHGHITPIILPTVPEILQPILYAIPIQMLAYATAVAMGREIDQPRNLAKSVTVE